jgi:CelD/BcsL family acetyltransferase involved in cellulose biosynthesis
VRSVTGVSAVLMSSDFVLLKNNTLQVRLFRGSAGLDALEEEWRSLVAELPHPRFIHYRAWYKSHLENTEANAEAVVFVLVCAASRPLAIFPLRRTTVRSFGLTLRTWEIFWRNDMGICDFVFVKTQTDNILLEALLDALNASKELSWDLLRLQDTLDDSCALHAMKLARLPLSLSVLHHYSKYIRCDADYETVMNRVSGSFRRNVRRQTKKLNELGNVEYRFVSAAEELDQAFQHFLQAEASSWKGDAGTGSAILLNPDKVGFYRTLMRDFSTRNACAINLILVDGKCIASQFCLVAGDTMYLLKIGYSEEFRAMGPGNVLLNELLQRCCADDHIKKLSFITGANWNDSWAPEQQDVYDNRIFNATLAGVIVFLLERIKDHGRHIKRWIRRARNRGASPA